MVDFWSSLFGSGSIFDLLILAVKLVALLFVISFVREKLGNSWFATAVTFVLAYIVLFQAWNIFGTVIIIYLFIILGGTGILMDLTITKPWQADAMQSAAMNKAKKGPFG